MSEVELEAIRVRLLRNSNLPLTVDLLFSEIARLKRGDFTEEEFQNLCHKFSADDACRFARGCLEYNRKLFGEKTRLALMLTEESNYG